MASFILFSLILQVDLAVPLVVDGDGEGDQGGTDVAANLGIEGIFGGGWI